MWIGAAARIRFCQISARKTPDTFPERSGKMADARALKWIKRHAPLKGSLRKEAEKLATRAKYLGK
jgi:hypothetical protein